MTSKNLLAVITLALAAMCSATAKDWPKGTDDRVKIDIGTTTNPKPHRLIDEPTAVFDTASGTLYITLDQASYSEYTVYLTCANATVGFSPTSPLLAIPSTALSDINYIEIDSDDCGTYTAVLDMTAIGNIY